MPSVRIELRKKNPEVLPSPDVLLDSGNDHAKFGARSINDQTQNYNFCFIYTVDQTIYVVNDEIGTSALKTAENL